MTKPPILIFILLKFNLIATAVAVSVTQTYYGGRINALQRPFARPTVRTAVKVPRVFKKDSPTEHCSYFDEDDYQSETKDERRHLSLAAVLRNSFFTSKQDLKYDVLYPLVHKQVSTALSQEFLLIQKEIAANLPDLPPLSRRSKVNKRTKFIVDSSTVEILNALIDANNAIRHLGRALRNSVLAVLSEVLSVDAVLPLIDSIAEAIVNNIDLNPVDFRLLFDPKEFKTRLFERLHPAIMKEFDSEDGIDLILDNYATQFALSGSRAVQSFFIFALDATPLSPRVIAKIQGNRPPPNRPKRSRNQQYSSILKSSTPAAGLPESVLKYAQSLGTNFAYLSVETLASLITGLTIAYSGLLKHIIRQSLSLPPIRQRILALFEVNIIRGYMPVKRLPKPVCPSNNRLTTENIWTGSKTKDERLRALEGR